MMRIWDDNLKRFRNENGEFTSSGDTLTKLEKNFGDSLFDPAEVAKDKATAIIRSKQFHSMSISELEIIATAPNLSFHHQSLAKEQIVNTIYYNYKSNSFIDKNLKFVKTWFDKYQRTFYDWDSKDYSSKNETYYSIKEAIKKAEDRKKNPTLGSIFKKVKNAFSDSLFDVIEPIDVVKVELDKNMDIIYNEGKYVSAEKFYEAKSRVVYFIKNHLNDTKVVAKYNYVFKYAKDRKLLHHFTQEEQDKLLKL